MHRIPLCLLLILGLAAAAEDDQVALDLPPQVELGRLVDMVGELSGVSVEYNPQRLRGTVKLDLRQRYTRAELWSVFNRVLQGQGFTTVVAGVPPLYHVVALNEAAALSRVLTPAQLRELQPRPGYATIITGLAHLPPETAVQALGNLLGQSGQARSLGRDNDQVIIAGPSSKVEEALRVLETLDVEGLQPAFRQYRPQFATPQKLQAAATAAWNAGARVSGRQTPVEVQLTPDAKRLLVIAPQERVDDLVALIEDLDRSEPATTESYRPRYFSADDVAGLIEQILHNESTGERVQIVRDHLTGSLVITATEAQHQRVAKILAELDQAPATARRTMRQFVIKHRAVADLVAVLRELLQGGVAQAQAEEPGPELQPVPPAEAGIADPPPTVTGDQEATAGTPGITPPEGRIPRSRPPRGGQDGPVQAPTGGEDVVLSTDELTNTLIAFGSSRILDQIEELIGRLDTRQPQVELEITLVSLSETESLQVGVDLAGERQSGSLDGNLASLFGVSDPSNTGVTGRSLNDFTGLGGLIINPGDWAVAFQALETINNGRSVVTGRVVVDNAAEASIDGVEQRPVSSTASNQNAAITGFGGTSDAGTQLTITPQIGAADQVTLVYTVSQSSFTGESVTTGDGAVLPPPRTANTFSSIATVPDGHVIALGGLLNQRKSKGHTGLPWLARIPFLGILFRRQSQEDSESRFFVFIRVNVLRHPDFADLKHLSGPRRAQAEVEDAWPELEPRFLD